MSGSRTGYLYNFAQYEPPDPIPELLSLLGIGLGYDKHGRVFVLIDLHDQYEWAMVHFRGGTLEDWTKKLSELKDARRA